MPSDQGHAHELTIDGLAGEVTTSIHVSVETHKRGVSEQPRLIYQLNKNGKV